MTDFLVLLLVLGMSVLFLAIMWFVDWLVGEIMAWFQQRHRLPPHSGKPWE